MGGGGGCVYLGQVLLSQRAVGVVVQAALQTLEAEGVSTRSGDRLIEQPLHTEHKLTLTQYPNRTFSSLTTALLPRTPRSAYATDLFVCVCVFVQYLMQREHSMSPLSSRLRGTDRPPEGVAGA